MEDVMQGLAACLARAVHASRRGCGYTRRQQYGNVVSARQLVVHNDAVYAQTGHTFGGVAEAAALACDVPKRHMF